MSNNAVSIKHLNKSYGKLKAVDDLNFTVQPAECFGLLGPNGAGKTTTMKILYGKSQPDATPTPYIDIFGHHPKQDALVIKSFSGIVPQQDNLDTELNVRDNLYIYSRFYGLSGSDALKRIAGLLDFMELSEKAQVKIRELSGGMQRRLTIARALINQPRLLILDEPTTGLDPQVRHLIWNKLRELKEQGVTVLLTTHYMEEAFQICDRIIIMDKGRKMLEGVPRELMKANLEAYVMEVYGADGHNYPGITLDQPGIRCETYQDTLFVYSDKQDRLVSFAESLSLSDYYIRQANLEDLFLKVTGRSLNELQ
ncbi:MAG: ATP-binding cassette domain-containing protein [Syntrophomonadaceae bacterium]|nr:ATP-binding cassette domain-containing protein [Syntrophomonadaceae bacterium]